MWFMVLRPTVIPTLRLHTCNEMQKFRLNHLLPLEKFFYSRRGWMTNKISLLLVVWTSSGCCERAGVGDASYWEREREKACSALASRVSPLQRPIQLPLMTAALAVSPLSRIRSLFEEEQGKEHGKSIKKGKGPLTSRVQYVINAVRSLNLKVMGGFRMPWLCRLISAGDWLCRWCAWWSLPSAGGRHWSAALIYL